MCQSAVRGPAHTLQSQTLSHLHNLHGAVTKRVFSWFFLNILHMESGFIYILRLTHRGRYSSTFVLFISRFSAASKFAHNKPAGKMFNIKLRMYKRSNREEYKKMYWFISSED